MIQDKLLKDFEEWLNNNTGILPRTKYHYLKVIRMFLSSAESASIDNINKFLHERKCHVFKYPFKYFLEFLDREDDYSKIMSIRRKPKGKYGVYVDKKKISDMIHQIIDENYYIVAKIQYLTGARANDILSLKRNNVRKKEDCIVLNLITKGEKEHTVAIPYPEAKEIIDYIEKTQREYPFLKGKRRELARWVDNNYRYYYEHIRRASELTGLKGFRTHDFRRNLANDIYKATKDIFLAKRVLGHKNIAHTEIYLERLNREDAIKEAIEKFRR